MTSSTKTTRNNAEIHEAVRAAYGGRVKNRGCCGASDVGTAAQKMGYTNVWSMENGYRGMIVAEWPMES